ncbi:type II toxin-antitoxin system RelE/ParE family toxin [bacterium]|nr:type II toxin-antitoxin system RelE/ParE family toxin [bacterium]
MSNRSIELLKYLDERGHSPFRDWLDGLKDRQARAKIRVRLGNLGDTKSVGSGINELRIPYGPGYRIYYGRHGNQIIILLLGGDKGSQTADIALAQAYWEDYRRRQK